MVELNKSLQKPKELPRNVVKPKKCPVCSIHSEYVYPVCEARLNKTALWYRCACGVIFQENYPAGEPYNEKYIADYVGSKEYSLRSIHAARTYVNLIEELTYGRMLLDVGCISTNNIDFFQQRGWLTWGIDINTHTAKTNNMYIGDFTTYNFQPRIENKELHRLVETKEIKRTFDLIWMSHVLEHFNNPIVALKKAIELLSESGVIYISTPDIDFMIKTGIPDYPHWKQQEHYLMWSERALVREVEKLGMKVIMKRRNFSSRYQSWYDIHLLCQKLYF